MLTVQTPTPRITSPLHLGSFPVRNLQGPPIRSRPLNEIPQIVLGRLAKCDDFEVTVMFPSAVRSKQQTTRLPDKWYDIWLEHIWLPAIYDTIPAASTSTYPTSAEDARLKSTMKSRITRIKGSQQEPRQQLLSYFVNPRYLKALWNRVLRNIASSPYEMFNDAWLLVIAKGIKSFYQDIRWSRMMQQYREHMRTLFRADAFTFKWNDVGYQFSPESSGIQHSRHRGEGQVLLWNTSYIEEILAEIHDLDTSVKHNVKTYAQYFVPGTGTATFEPASKSRLRKAGLAYAQFYHNVKDF